MYKTNKKGNSRLRYAIVILGTVLFSSITLFVLEKSGITNFYSVKKPPLTESQTVSEVPSASPTNTVDYSIAKRENTPAIADKDPSQPVVPPTNPELTVVITNTRVSGSLFLVKGVISGTDTATCRATMTNAGKSVTFSSGASTIEGQYSCKDLSIPVSQLVGYENWYLELTVTDKTGSNATTSQDVKI